MANDNTAANDNLFTSLVSDIKTYTGRDPLLPWLRGIKKMTDSLPPELLKQKLPRFLQKCAQTFETDRRYRNDLRYIRVWIKLLDFVDDPGAVLENMKANHIGDKRSLFYQAYALYYEKMKKLTEAEKMYHLGVQNFAEPLDELRKSFEQFLHRMERHKKKRTLCHEGRTTGNHPGDDVKQKTENATSKGRSTGNLENENLPKKQSSSQKMSKDRIAAESEEHATENTVVVKFAKTAFVGKSEAEDARHHGLVEPTITTKEAMDAIGSMFREPLGPEPIQSKGSRRRQQNGDKSLKNDFKVSIDFNRGSRVESSSQNQPMEEPFQIYCDDNNDERSNEVKEITQEKNKFEGNMVPKTSNGTFVFPRSWDVPLESDKDLDMERPQAKFREDTVVFRFVGSTISDEPKVENVCHHGLVEPTVNLKEAMDDINNMFGKPIEFVRKRRPRKQEKTFEERRACSAFLILPDDDMDHQQQGTCQPSSSSSRNERELFEQTVCTKEAMDDINKMFAMPLDF